jgi:signal peptidase II
MPLGDSYDVFGWSWFQIHFIENPGMAFGIEWGGNMGKLGLSLFRIGAISVIGYLLVKLIRQKASMLVLTSIALIFAGAVGNILDSVFYGLLFSRSTLLEAATFLPPDGGYTGILYGKVVDMLYFPLIDTTWPAWVPFLGTKPLKFFEFIFNVADASVFCGTAMVFIFYKHFFSPPPDSDLSKATTVNEHSE